MSLEKNGFTIVELLIVVVVIAILAAITIVSYNGISAKANDSAVVSALQSTVKKLKVDSFDTPAVLCYDNYDYYLVESCLNNSPIFNKISGSFLKKDSDVIRYYRDQGSPSLSAKSTSGKIFRIQNGSVKEISNSEYLQMKQDMQCQAWAIYSSTTNKWTTDYMPC